MLILDEADEMLNKGTVVLDSQGNHPDLLCRIQRANLRRLPFPAARHTGGALVGHAASRDPRDDEQVYDRSVPRTCKTVRRDSPKF